MKTITESILFMALSMLVALFCVLGALLDICTHSWWNLAMNILLVCVNVWIARKCYKRAKRIEESREMRIRMIYDILPIDEIIVHRIMSEVFKGIKTKDEKDEVEADNGTPV